MENHRVLQRSVGLPAQIEDLSQQIEKTTETLLSQG
jgi:hypothetical protein